MADRERIVILLDPPMRVDVVVRLLAAVNREFPGATVPCDDPAGNLVIVVELDDGPAGDPPE